MKLATAWLLATGLLLGSCGSEPAPAGPPGRTRALVLRPAVDAAAPEPPTRLAHYQIFGELPKWQISAGQTDVRRTELDEGQKVNALWLTGPVGSERTFELRISGSFDPIEIDRLAASLVFRGNVLVEAALLRDQVRIASGAVAAQNEGANTVELRFEPPADYELCNELLLKVSGTDRLGIVELELFRDPETAVLPSLRAPAPVEIEGEWRTAVGLSNSRPMETSFLVQPGHALRVDYGLPHLVRGPVPPLEIEVELSTESGGRRMYNLPFEYDLVVVYSEYEPGVRQARRQRQKLLRIKNPNTRKNMEKKMLREANEKNKGKAFGEGLQPRRREQPNPASVRSGLVDGWIQRTINLDEFVGQKVAARFRLITEPGYDAIAALSPPTLLGTRQETPLVVLITSDAHRADHLTAAGLDGAIETPWMEILARRGVVFADAWSSTNDTLAAHEAIFSGRPRHPLNDQLPPSLSLPAALEEAGWHTVAILSTPALGPVRSDLTAGFSHVLAPHEEIGADGALDTLVELLPELDDRACFAWVHLRDAVAPYDPPEEFRREHYDGPKAPKRPRHVAPAPAAEGLPEWAEGISDLGYVQALYSSEITWIDRRLRVVVEHPVLARAVVAFAGSFGESLTHFGHDRLSPETLRVPLFVTGPGLATEDPIQRPVAVHDLGRTLLDLVRREDTAFPGVSLIEGSIRRGPGAARTKGQAPDARAAGPRRPGSVDPTTGERLPPVAPPQYATAANDSTAVVVYAGYLFELELDPDGHPEGPGALYALELDPECEVDISAAEPEPTNELRALLKAWLAQPPGLAGESAAWVPEPAAAGSSASLSE